MAVTALAETKFARCDVHTVTSEDGTGLIRDWIFLEVMPMVVVVVRTVDGDFLVFDQKKYAIPGSTLSPVGGMIEVGESPLAAAKREVLEELGVGSRRMLRVVKENIDDPTEVTKLDQIVEILSRNADKPSFDEFGLLDGETRGLPSSELDEDWTFLGRYRTAANRGGGFVYTYLLKNAVPLLSGGGTSNYIGTGDDESQEILHLEEKDVMNALSEGKFQEVKWLGTFSLAMLHLKDGMPACCGNE